jgi:hypothetical protein
LLSGSSESSEGEAPLSSSPLVDSVGWLDPQPATQPIAATAAQK